MKKKILTALIAITILGVTEVKADGIEPYLVIDGKDTKGYVSTLNLPYGGYNGGRQRYFGTGTHLVSIQVDSINTSSGNKTTGTGRMEISLYAPEGGGNAVHTDISNYAARSCYEIRMGSYGESFKTFTFNSNIYNSSKGAHEKFNGVKSSKAVLYPWDCLLGSAGCYKNNQ